MRGKRHVLVLDTIPYPGGSKVATASMLAGLDPNAFAVTVVTADKGSWRRCAARCTPLLECSALQRYERGLGYFLRHAMIVFSVLLARLRFGRVDVVVGASGPGVDFALYLAQPLLGCELVQLIHGPVACSRTIGRCLRRAGHVHYLPSAEASVRKALQRVMTPNAATRQLAAPNFHQLHNGLDEAMWPSPCRRDRPVLFWAASLLEWKGLDVLLAALRALPVANGLRTEICYIRPLATDQPVCAAPVDISDVHWHETPPDLDAIRASANIFVSTARDEPFGLSILEAMAAGHCVVLPADGAYWDCVLEHDLNCVKYAPGDAQELACCLCALSQDPARVARLGDAAAAIAGTYRARSCYASLRRCLGESTQTKVVRDVAARAAVLGR